jgi:hypothetical protein
MGIRYLRLAPLAVTLTLGSVLSCGAATNHERARTLAPSKPKPSNKCADPAKLGDAVLTVSDMPTGFGEVPPLNPENAIRLGGGSISSVNMPVPTAAPPVFRGFQQGTQSLVPGPTVTEHGRSPEAREGRPQGGEGIS